MAPLAVARAQAVAHRLRVNHLAARLPAGSYVEAAWAGLQDTAPRDALVALHSRVEQCKPSAWEAPGLVQTYGPRLAVYVLPQDAFATFTLGRTSYDPAEASRITHLAQEVCEAIGDAERLGALDPQVRIACVSGRLAVRWTASALYAREVPRPDVDVRLSRRVGRPVREAVEAEALAMPVPGARMSVAITGP